MSFQGIGHCSQTVYKTYKGSGLNCPSLSKEETAMKVKVTTCEFIRLLQAAKEFDRQFSWLGQAMWLLDCWTDFTDGYVRLNLPE